MKETIDYQKIEQCILREFKLSKESLPKGMVTIFNLEDLMNNIRIIWRHSGMQEEKCYWRMWECIYKGMKVKGTSYAGCFRTIYNEGDLAKNIRDLVSCRDTERYCKRIAELREQYLLDRFIDAQADTYASALAEIRAGYKQGHWIWYIFPQMKGLGLSSMSEYYGIGSREEAEAYLEEPYLRERLLQITQALLAHKDEESAEEILGYTDAMKVRSCMTLFDAVCPDDVFAEVLDAFYNGERCLQTLEMLEEI